MKACFLGNFLAPNRKKVAEISQKLKLGVRESVVGQGCRFG